MTTLVNNKFVKELKVKADSPLIRGFGIFETLRTHNGKLFKSKAHINRLFSSAKQINIEIKYNKKEISEMLEKVIKKAKYKNQRLKIIAIPNQLIISSTKQIDDPKIYQGVSVMSTKAKRELPELKSISYLTSYLSHEQAVKKGYFDALLTDENQEIYECAYANLFWFENNTLYTRKGQILPGITRQTILKISPFKIKFKTITLKDLKKADEVFFDLKHQGNSPHHQNRQNKNRLKKTRPEYN